MGVGATRPPGSAAWATSDPLSSAVTTPTCGSQMPLGGTPLTAAQTGEIESWIHAGAMND
jgi:hypothetical protein